MNAELKQPTDPGFWTHWPGQLVDGTFPLRRLLGFSSRSAVFLTEHKARGLPDAAIKFVRLDGRPPDPLLEQWGGAATIEHPHLVRLFETGRFRFAEQQFVFVVMEYADQTLAEILRRRALHPDELLEMLVPTLEALTFLHRRHLVHLQLKPCNVLAVGDRLKLSSDSIRPLGQRAHAVTVAYDPPELKDNGITAAADLWSLGGTLVEALTQRTPSGSELRFEQDLPASLPASLRDTVRRCLSLRHTERPSVIELRSEYKHAAPAAEPRPQPPSPPASGQFQSPIQPALRTEASSQPATESQLQVPTSAELQRAHSQQPSSVHGARSTVQSPLHAQPEETRSAAPLPAGEQQSQAVQVAPPSSAPPQQERTQLQSSTHVQRSQPGLKTQQAEAPATHAPVRREAAPLSDSAVSRPPPQISQSPEGAVQSHAMSAAGRLQSPHATVQVQRPQATAQPPSSQAQLQPPQATAQDEPPQASPGAPPPQSIAGIERPYTTARPQPPQVQPQPHPAEASAEHQRPPARHHLQPPQTTPQHQPPRERQPEVERKAEASELEELATEAAAPKRLLALLIIAVSLGILVVAWLDFRSPATTPAPSQPPIVTPAPAVRTPTPEQRTDASTTASEPALEAEPSPPAEPASSVMKEVIPTVPAKIQSGIQGRIYVTVRLLVDPAGDVTAVLMEKPGPSKYFARLADNAAREWKFAPIEGEDDRVWLVSFRFTREDVTASATER